MTVQVLGQKIRYLRRREGLSQEEFAARAGVSHRKLSDIECGNGNPTFDTMDCIAAAFGLQIEELLQPDIEVDLLPRRELSRLQPMVDAFPRRGRSCLSGGRRALWPCGSRPSAGGNRKAPVFCSRAGGRVRRCHENEKKWVSTEVM